MNNGLLNPAIISFVFAPLVVTVALLLSIWWKQITSNRAALPALDTPGLALASAVRQLPEERRDWGAAMLAELGEIRRRRSRWWFALNCARVALFPPRGAGLPRHSSTGKGPVCGMLAVALPPLGLPFIYLATVIVEAIGGSPFTQSSRWNDPDAVMAVVRVIIIFTLFCLLAGLPLGLAGVLRRERLRRLSVMGMFLSAGIIGYFMAVMSFVAVGPHGD
jgi:hypothetical protein